MLYGTAISQSDCRKAGPYQLPIIISSTGALYSLLNKRPKEIGWFLS